MDIEGAELGTLPQWMESGLLQRVDQMGIELHLADIHQVRLEPTKTASYHFYQEQRFPWLLGLLQQLYTQGFRIISHEVKTLNRTFVLIS